MQNLSRKQKKGFTLIETMISVSIFTIIILFGMNVLLNVNLVSNKSKDMREIMDNLSFIMEEMSRNLRTGYNYHCTSSFPASNIHLPRDCTSDHMLAFEEARFGDPTDDTDQWIYEIESNNGDYGIYKSENGGVDFVQLNSPEIALDPLTSYFTVVGSVAPVPSGGDQQQPYVVIRLTGEITYKDTVTPFNLQTIVSQRLIDVPL